MLVIGRPKLIAAQVSIFFLPLTFVTSVFGMTNMPQEHNFRDFAIVMASVCVPFLFLIGSLNTTSGMEFWQNKWHSILDWVTRKSTLKATKKAHIGDKLEGEIGQNLPAVDSLTLK